MAHQKDMDVLQVDPVPRLAPEELPKPRIEIAWTKILWGDEETDVIPGISASGGAGGLVLRMKVLIDLRLVVECWQGANYDYEAAFRTVELASNQVQENCSSGQLQDLLLPRPKDTRTPRPALLPGYTSFWAVILTRRFEHPLQAVAASGFSGFSRLYALEPTFTVERYEDRPTGESVFAVGERRHFMIEAVRV